jgi:hypothetical protein
MQKPKFVADYMPECGACLFCVACEEINVGWAIETIEFIPD